MFTKKIQGKLFLYVLETDFPLLSLNENGKQGIIYPALR